MANGYFDLVLLQHVEKNAMATDHDLWTLRGRDDVAAGFTAEPAVRKAS